MILAASSILLIFYVCKKENLLKPLYELVCIVTFLKQILVDVTIRNTFLNQYLKCNKRKNENKPNFLYRNY